MMGGMDLQKPMMEDQLRQVALSIDFENETWASAEHERIRRKAAAAREAFKEPALAFDALVDMRNAQWASLQGAEWYLHAQQLSNMDPGYYQPQFGSLYSAGGAFAQLLGLQTLQSGVYTSQAMLLGLKQSGTDGEGT